MKINKLLLCLLSLLVFVSCANDDDYETVQVASAITMSVAELRNSTSVLPPQNISESGKVYVKDHLILINDKKEGIHLIDNTNPANPQKTAFLKVLGSNDMEIKGDYLYVDSYMDLVVFDISNLTEIKEVERLEDVFPYYAPYPVDATYINYNTYPQDQKAIVVGWNIKEERRKIEDNPVYYDVSNAAFSESFSSSETGQGGSLARFKIVNNYLYAVDYSNINVFDISNLNTPQKKESVEAGFDIETIFNRGEYLFLGSMNGLYIYDIKTPAVPSFVSEFRHVTSCDPVVVDGDYAFVTLRGGSFCGAINSSLRVIDISDIMNPVEKSSYTLEEPYGLGVKNDKLYVCDGDAGLKVFDKKDVPSVKLLETYDVEKAYDVIPLANSLIMIGDGTLYQYSYLENGLELVSEFEL
ncbi:LVIVD repeat-containing protein [Galbibacter sp. BG1]